MNLADSEEVAPLKMGLLDYTQVLLRHSLPSHQVKKKSCVEISAS